jgi:hypothetical protein
MQQTLGLVALGVYDFISSRSAILICLWAI